MGTWLEVRTAIIDTVAAYNEARVGEGRPDHGIAITLPATFHEMTSFELAHALLEVPDAMPPQLAMIILVALGKRTYPDEKNLAVTMLSHVTVAICKQGNATQQALTKVQRDITAELATEGTFIGDCIRLFHMHFCGRLNETNIQSLFAAWERWLPQAALRMRLFIQQTAFAGLTAFVTIGRAVRKYNDFPWGAVGGIIPDDITRFCEADAAVNGNAYYGFSADLGVVKSTRYKNLAWVCKTLLINIGGENSLNSYRGWVARPVQYEALNTLIIDYTAARDRALAGQVNQAVADQLLAAAQNNRNNQLFAA